MLRKAYISATVIIGCMGAGAAVLAQSNSGDQNSRPSLSDRFQQLRENLFVGDSEQEGRVDQRSQQQTRPGQNGHRPSPRGNDPREPVTGAPTRYNPQARSNVRQPSNVPRMVSRQGMSGPNVQAAQPDSGDELFDSSRRPPRYTGVTQAEDFDNEATMPRQSSRRTAQRDYSQITDDEVPLANPGPTQPEEMAVRPQRAADERPAPVRTARRPTVSAAPAELSDDVDSSQPIDSDEPAPMTARRTNPRTVPSPSHPTSERVATRSPIVPESGIDEGQDVLFERHGPSLSVETTGPRRVTIGKEATYHITVFNDGPAAAESVELSVKIPQGIEVTNTHSTAGTAGADGASNQGGLRWALSSLPSGGREVLSVTLVPRSSHRLDLGVAWTHAPLASQTVVEVQEPKLEMTITGPEEVFYGEKAKYRLTLSNPGTGDAENVAVRLLPTAAGETEAAGHRVGVLRAGDTKTVDLELTARQSGLVVIRAEALADSGLKSSVAAEVLVRRADVDVAIEGPEFQYAGTAATYQIRLSNPGNATAKNVQLAAIMPDGGQFVEAAQDGRVSADGGKVQWTFDSLGPGVEQVLWVKWSLATPGVNRPQVTVVADGDLTDSSTTSTQVEAVADLALDVRDPRVPVPVGEDVIYEVRLTNRGTKAAEGVDVFGFFSNGVEPIAVEGGSHRIAPGQVVFDPIRSLAPGEELVLKITASARQSGNHVFRAEVRCKALGISLATEETTRFYDRAGGTGSGTSGSAATEESTYEGDEVEDLLP